MLSNRVIIYIRTAPIIKKRNLFFLYFETENSSITTSLALIYIKVPELIAKNIPSINTLCPVHIIPNKIPIGVVDEKINMSFIISPYSTFECEKLIPIVSTSTHR